MEVSFPPAKSTKATPRAYDYEVQAVLRKGKSLTLRVEGETQNFPLAAGQKGFAVLAQRCGG